MRILTDERDTRPPEPPRLPFFLLVGVLLLGTGGAVLYWWTGRGAEAPLAERALPKAPESPAPQTLPLSRVRRGALEVAPDSAGIVVRFKEVRLDERIDVVHKHGIGSCRGRLIAGLDGLRYQTDHKDHGFSVPLDGLKRFEVNYLKKNLRVEVRGGKKYNFTEPKGDADVLFVFHKQVEKVRLR